MLKLEAQEIDDKVAGWTESLSRRDLSSVARAHIEQELSIALQRKQEIAVELDMLLHGEEHTSRVLDVKQATDRLRRLHEVIAKGSPSDINEEFSRHIESIRVFPTGVVVMRTSRLGIFEGADHYLSCDVTREEVLRQGTEDSDDFKIRPRTLTRRCTTGPAEVSRLVKANGVIEGIVNLPDKWVDESIFQIPKSNSWASRRSEEVFLRRQAARLSYAKLGAEFGVSAPTARAAVKDYLATHPEAKDEVNLKGGRRQLS